MAMIGDLRLDLRKVPLVGWEPFRSDKVIDAIVRGLEAGCLFPPVHVYRRQNGVYELVGPDGGHSRATGHYIVGSPLWVTLHDSPTVVNRRSVAWQRDYQRFPDVSVRDFVLCTDRGEYDLTRRLDQRYR